MDEYGNPLINAGSQKRKSSTFSRRRKHSTTEPPTLSSLPTATPSAAPTPSPSPSANQVMTSPQPHVANNWSPRLDTCYEGVSPQQPQSQQRSRSSGVPRPNSFSVRRPQALLPPSHHSREPHSPPQQQQQQQQQQQLQRRQSRQTAPPPPAYYSPTHPHPSLTHTHSAPSTGNSHPLTPHPGARPPPAYPGRKQIQASNEVVPSTPSPVSHQQRITPNFQVYQQQIPQ